MAEDREDGFASPACAMHEADAAYMFAPDMPRTELLDLLNVLIESERAGAKTLAAWVKEGKPGIAPDLLARVQRDEGRYVAGLSRQVRRLGGEPSPRTGRFFDKAMTLGPWADRLAFLDKGQRWVADRIAETLPKIRDPELRDFLAEMAARHEVNIAACAAAGGELSA